jgi:C4-dicarboxylate-specific signal transduction histidine kinase
MKTRILIGVSALVSLPIAATAHAQTTKAVVSAAAANAPLTAKSDGGGSSALNTVAAAQRTLEAIRSLCQLVENDGKLFAACDNSTAAAKMHGAMTYLPQIATEWETFTKRLFDADKRVNGKARPIVVLNGGDVVAEVTTGGVVTLRK